MAAPARPAFCCNWHVASADTRKAEDASIVCSSKQFASGVSLFAVADGHNGQAAVRAVALLLPAELDRQLGGDPPTPEGVQQALARTFVALDDSVCRQFLQSGCTLTAAVLSGDVLTVAHVGDSAAVLDCGAEVVGLTTEHRIGSSPSELARLEAAGGRLSRLNQYGSGPSCGTHEGVGPVRLWPGGIMVGRAIGDRDVGGILLPHPHICQVRLPPTGARLVLATDGLWDAVPRGRLVRLLRQHAKPKAAAMEAVSAVATQRGGLLTDDITVAVADLLPRGALDFLAVLAQFQSRLRSVLSDPSLLAQALEEAEEAQQAAAAEGQAHHQQRGLAQQGAEQQQGQRQVATPRRGLFACFGRPTVVESWQGSGPPSPGKEGEVSSRSIQARSRSLEVNARSGVARGERSAHSGWEPSARGGSCRGAALPGDFSTRSGQGHANEWSARSGRALGGSERSVRGGAERRDPSVVSCQAASFVEVLCDVDTVSWSPADFGQPPAPTAAHKVPAPLGADGCCSRTSRDSCQESSASDCVLHSSPRGLLELNQALGRSVDSLCSEPEEELHLRGLLRSFSVAPGKPLAQPAGLPRNASLPLLTDKKCRGGRAAAALLSLRS